MKIKGRPLKHAKRNQRIIADYQAGMTSADLAKKYKLTHGYAQKIASEYARKERIKAEGQEQAAQPVSADLFTGLDLCLWNFVAGLSGTFRKHKGLPHRERITEK